MDPSNPSGVDSGTNFSDPFRHKRRTDMSRYIKKRVSLLTGLSQELKSFFNQHQSSLVLRGLMLSRILVLDDDKGEWVEQGG